MVTINGIECQLLKIHREFDTIDHFVKVGRGKLSHSTDNVRARKRDYEGPKCGGNAQSGELPILDQEICRRS